MALSSYFDLREIKTLSSGFGKELYPYPSLSFLDRHTYQSTMTSSSKCAGPVCSNSSTVSKVRSPMPPHRCGISSTFIKIYWLSHRCLVCDAQVAKHKGKKFGLSQARTVTSVTHLVHDSLKVLCCTFIMGEKTVWSHMCPYFPGMTWFSSHHNPSQSYGDSLLNLENEFNVRIHGRPANILEIDTTYVTPGKPQAKGAIGFYHGVSVSLFFSVSW